MNNANIVLTTRDMAVLDLMPDFRDRKLSDIFVAVITYWL
jgi:hypothetical protein